MNLTLGSIASMLLFFLAFYSHSQLYGEHRTLTVKMADYLPDASMQQVLDQVTPYAQESDWLLVQGWGFGDSVFPLWIHEQGLPAVVVQNWDESVFENIPSGEDIVTYAIVEPPFPATKGDENADLSAIYSAISAAGVTPLNDSVTRHQWSVRIFTHTRAPLDEFHASTLPRSGADQARDILETRNR